MPSACRRLLLLLVAVALPAAGATTEVALEKLTSPEVAAAIAAGTTTILVPVGGTEQNGPHMTLGKHNARAAALAERIAQGLGNALVAPVVAYVPEGSTSPPSAHMRYAGTISVPSATFVQLLEAAGRSFRAHGFRDVVFLGDHGGYQPDLQRAAAALNREWAGTPARAHALDAYYRATEAPYAAELRRRGYTTAEIGTHAGLADTSLALAVAPQTVRADKLPAPGSPPAPGVGGDPARASAELGAIAADAIVRDSIAAIRAATRRSP